MLKRSVQIYVFIYVSMYTYVCMYVCIHMCVCVYIHTYILKYMFIPKSHKICHTKVYFQERSFFSLTYTWSNIFVYISQNLFHQTVISHLFPLLVSMGHFQNDPAPVPWWNSDYRFHVLRVITHSICVKRKNNWHTL